MTALAANPGAAHSWYDASAGPYASLPGLRGTVTADVAIIGAGYTGLSAALALAQAGKHVVVAEAERIGWGASGRNGGQVGSGQRVDQVTLEHQMGADAARALWQIAQDAKAEVHRLMADHRIDADWRGGVAYVARRASGAEGLQAYALHLQNDYGYDDVTPLSRKAAQALTGSDDVHGGQLDRGAGHLHPVKFLHGLADAARAAGVVIHEGSRVARIKGKTLVTGAGALTADRVVIATNGYGAGLHRDVDRRVLPINSFIAVTEPLDAPPLTQGIAVADDRFVVNYWRMVDGNRLLFGGGESYALRYPRDIAARVRRPLAALYPALRDLRIDYAWGGTLGITPTRNPYFAECAPGVFTAGGYSGHGVALATLGGRILAEAILGERTRFDLMARLPVPPLPGGALARRTMVPLAMQFYAMRDRLGI
ncbi:MAG: FAD-binding oxidoreductase [Pseudomonadota bacterium]